MAVDVIVVGRNYCGKWFNSKINQNMFCAGYEQGNKDAYQSDFGGPIISIDIIFFFCFVKVYHDTII